MTTLACDEPFAGDVTGVASGVVSAEERLAEVAPMVRRMCVARLGLWDGEDAAQEVLLRVWQMQQRPDYDGAPVFGWAAANARFEALNAFKSPARRMVPTGDLGERYWVDPAAGPEEQAERRASARAAQARVRELLPRLSMRERQVLLVSEFGMRSNVETGDRLGMTRDAVSVAKQNAIARMRELVGVTAAGTRTAQHAAAYQALKARRESVRAAGPAGEAAGSWLRGVPLPGEVHDAGRAAAGFGWSTQRLIGEFGVSAETVRQWRSGQASESALSEAALSALIGRAHAARAESVDRAAAAQVRAVERGSVLAAGPRMRWPEEVHAAGRAAVRNGWSNQDLVGELGVSTDLVTRWRRAPTADDGAGEDAAAEQVSTRELIERAHRSLDEARRRHDEVQACAQEFGGTRRGRGQAVPDEVVARAREAARNGWTPADLERGFGLSRNTARRWIREETQASDDPRADDQRPDDQRPDDARASRDNAARDNAGRDNAGRDTVDRNVSGRDDSDGDGDGRGEDPLTEARRAVAALPSPQQARAASDERDLLDHALTDHATSHDHVVEQGNEDGSEDTGDLDDGRAVSAA